MRFLCTGFLNFPDQGRIALHCFKLLIIHALFGSTDPDLRFWFANGKIYRSNLSVFFATVMLETNGNGRAESTEIDRCR